MYRANLWRFLPAHQDEFLALLSRQGRKRVLLVDPMSPAVAMAAFRSTSKASAITQSNRLKDNLDLLKRWKSQIPDADLQVRVFDYLPPYGITIIYPQDAGLSPFCLVRLMTFRTPTSKAPAAIPDPVTSTYWLNFFQEQFNLMWDAAAEYQWS